MRSRGRADLCGDDVLRDGLAARGALGSDCVCWQASALVQAAGQSLRDERAGEDEELAPSLGSLRAWRCAAGGEDEELTVDDVGVLLHPARGLSRREEASLRRRVALSLASISSSRSRSQRLRAALARLALALPGPGSVTSTRSYPQPSPLDVLLLLLLARPTLPARPPRQLELDSSTDMRTLLAPSCRPPDRPPGNGEDGDDLRTTTRTTSGRARRGG